MSLVMLRQVTRTVTIPDAAPLQILVGIDLDIAEGDRLAIVGRSGSGKSTLLNILGMLDQPSSGQMEFDGNSVLSMSQRERDRVRGANIGFIFQQFNLIDGLTALENVIVPLMYATGPRFWRRESIAYAMLKRVGLGHRAHSRIGTLSGGEQQRIAIARALVRSPRLILADEPTGALDLQTGEAIMELLEEVAADSDAALVTITHDLAVAARMSRSARLETGALYEQAGVS